MHTLAPEPQRKLFPERIIQFGEGNFLRGFVDWMVDVANEKTAFQGSIVVVQPLSQGMAAAINAQGGLYTVVGRGLSHGQPVEDFRLVRSISRAIDPHLDFASYAALATQAELRFLVSNTTEAGISWQEEARVNDRPQESFPAKVAAFLHARWRHFHGDPSKGMVVIPCELIDRNGDKLKELVLRHAAAWGLERDFSPWVEKACEFCNSLVDRIVPGYPREEAPALWTRLGYRDELLVAAEAFHIWVIESREDHSQDFPLAEAGLQVVWTDDMAFYRTRKVRILNGAHTLAVPAAWLAGLDTVQAMVEDPLLRRFMETAIFQEIIPAMDGDQTMLRAYADDVLERFANPWIRHLLLSITLNSVSKFATRDLPSIKDHVERFGRVPPLLSFSLAALIAFYEGGPDGQGGFEGRRDGLAYPLKDSPSVLERFAELYREHRDPVTRAFHIAHGVLGETDWWGEDLRKLPGFREAVQAGLEAIWSRGIRGAMEALLDGGPR